MNRRKLIRKVEKAGYREDRNDGGHAIYEKKGCRPLQIPNHKEINEYTAKQILKMAGIKD